MSSSHVVFTSSPSVVKPLVTETLTLRCNLRYGATAAIIGGKRDAVSEVNRQGKVKYEVPVGGQAVSEVIPGGQENDDDTSHDAQPIVVIPQDEENDDVSFVHSMIISKNGADIATVTEHVNATALDQTPDINVTGHILVHGSGAEKGFLEVTWKHPGPDQSGSYQCTVLGTDRLGHLQSYTETVGVFTTDVSINDVIGYIQQLKITNDIHASTIASLKQSNDIQTSIIANQSLAMSDMEKEITELKQKQNTTVMFSAYLGPDVTASPGDVIVFNEIITNVGNSYDPATGVFTCPDSGYYVFDVHVMGQMDKIVGVLMYLNGSQLGFAYADNQLDNQSASGYVSVLLKQGDKVNVKAYTTSYLQGVGAGHCTFSGHLVNLL